jgi:DNA-binding XRE family transcriptional regulator
LYNVQDWVLYIKGCRTSHSQSSIRGGVDPVYITQIEKHNKLPSEATAKRICAILKDESLLKVWKENKDAHARKKVERVYLRTASTLGIDTA